MNLQNAENAGELNTESPHIGLQVLRDGAIGAYDAITQPIATTIGATYRVTFWLKSDFVGTFQSISNGGSGLDGNGLNLVVFAGDIPTAALDPPVLDPPLTPVSAPNPVCVPALNQSGMLMLTVLMGLLLALRVRRR